MLGFGSVGELALTEDIPAAAGGGVAISGMAWFTPPQGLPPKKGVKEQAPTFVRAPAVFNTVGWIARSQDVIRIRRVEAPQPTFVARRFVQPQGWFVRADDIRVVRRRPIDQPTLVTIPDATLRWWHGDDQPPPRKKPVSDQQPTLSYAATFPAFYGWLQAPQEFVRVRVQPFANQPAHVLIVPGVGNLITDTDILQLPVDCVLAGQQPYEFTAKDKPIPATYSSASHTPRSRRTRLSGSKPSFSSKSGPLGGSHKE